MESKPEESKLAEKFFKHPWIIVAVIALITVFFALQLPRVTLDNNNIRFVPEDDEARVTATMIDDTFGSSSFVLVGLKMRYGTVFNAQFLERVRSYCGEIEGITLVDKVTSIVNADYITARGDSVVVEPLVADDFSGSSQEIAELKNRLLSWDMYRHSLVSDDFSSTQILVSLEVTGEAAGGPEVMASFVQIRTRAQELFSELAEVYVTGMPAFSSTINEAVGADLILLVPLVILVVLTVLFFSFRRISAVVLPLLTVLIAVIWSVGAMPLFGVKLSVLSTVLPVILVAVGSAYGIHIITHYLEDKGTNKGMTDAAHREMIFALLKKIGKPVSLAALTTLVGFSSFCFTKVLPIREFGFFASFGVLVSFLVAITLIPALLLIRGSSAPKSRAAEKRGGSKKTLENTADESYRAEGGKMSAAIADAFTAITRKKYFIITVAVFAVIVSIFGVTKVVIDNAFVEYFKPTADIARSDVFIREQFGGSKVVSVVASSEDAGGVLHPDVLGALDALEPYLMTRIPEVGKVTGFTHLIKRTNQVFNADESPDGIKPSAATAIRPPDLRPDGGFGFGFDSAESVEEDSFGFGNFSAPTTIPAAPSVSGGNSILRQKLDTDVALTKSELAEMLAAVSGDSWTLSGGDLVRGLEKAVNINGAAYYEIPADPVRYGKTDKAELTGLVSNYLVLLAGGAIDSYANDPLEPTSIKTTVQLRTVGQKDSRIAIDAIQEYARTQFPDTVKIIVGGSALIEEALNHLVVDSQVISVIISLLMVFIIMSAANKSPVAGIIGIVPLSLSILMNFAVMGFLGIKLDIGTALVASVSVGIGIDYTIHYLGSYKREYLASGGSGDFLRRTFATSGKAILINAVSVGAGFAVLIFSQFNMLRNLGLLISLTMGTSALVSLTVLPVLLIITKPAFIAKGA